MTERRRQWNSSLPARSEPLKRGQPPQRKTRPTKRNAKRGGHRLPKLVNKAFRAWVRRQPCVVLGIYADVWLPDARLGNRKSVIDPAHVRSRGAGHPDAANIVPLERALHEELDHQFGRRLFEQKYGIDLEACARDTWDAYLQTQPPKGVTL